MPQVPEFTNELLLFFTINHKLWKRHKLGFISRIQKYAFSFVSITNHNESFATLFYEWQKVLEGAGQQYSIICIMQKH